MSRLDDYLRLFRVPNVFTAIADVTMGYLLVHRSFSPVFLYAALVCASALFYIAGMAWNDVFDAEQDAAERPERPIPAGQISRRTAAKWAAGLLLAGVAIAVGIGYLPGGEETGAWRSGPIGLALAVCILLYDGVLKRSFAGPIAMGTCRSLNVLLGISTGAMSPGGGIALGYEPAHLIAAGAIGLYVVGVTWFARREAAVSRSFPLAFAAGVMMGGLGLLCLLHPYLPAVAPPQLDSALHWMLLIGLLGFTILRRCVMAISNPSPKQVQLAVKHSLWSLIVLDAAVVLDVCPWPYAIVVLLLLVPTVALGFAYPST